jgi:hypothetical protein
MDIIYCYKLVKNKNQRANNPCDYYHKADISSIYEYLICFLFFFILQCRQRLPYIASKGMTVELERTSMTR